MNGILKVMLVLIYAFILYIIFTTDFEDSHNKQYPRSYESYEEKHDENYEETEDRNNEISDIINITSISNETKRYLLLSVRQLQNKPYLLHPLPLNVRKLVNDIKLGIEPGIPPLNTYNYNTTLRCDNVCSDNVQLLVLVKANPVNIEHRKRIRTMWKHTSVQHKIIFVTGFKDRKYDSVLSQENELYKDILQFDFVDTYGNLTLKLMLAFQWIVEHCYNVPYVVIIDDDVDLWIDNVFNFFNSTVGKAKYFYGGHVDRPRKVIRSNHKNGLSVREYAFSVFADFPSGCCSFFTAALIWELYHGSFYTQFIRNDDAYIGILAAKLNFHPVDLRNVVFLNPNIKDYSLNTILCRVLQRTD